MLALSFGGDGVEIKRSVPRLADVARLAGVSPITASRVVRGEGPIAQATRQRVLDAVQQLGYVPNRAAGALASSSSKLIGVLIPSLTNIVFPDVLRGINVALAASGYQALVGVTEYDPRIEQEIVASLLAWNPEALILTGFDHTDATRRMLDNHKVRIAELMEIDETPIDVAVGLSHPKAGLEIGRHLIAKGYRKFGYVGHDWRADRRSRLRYDGLRAALADHGLGIVAEHYSEGPSSIQKGRQSLASLLEQGRELDVVVFSNDDMAVGGYLHCVAAGLAVRDDLALFGFNGLEIGEALPHALSTIYSDRFRIGKIAAEKLLEQKSRPAEQTIIDIGFVLREGQTA
ncbi:LacI family DNA-binding transcriptional regulator [Shinella daejeonensis]|nr:LacI family DNA-binding transcriptional regulator [Shinella daejeonensis]